MIEDISAFAYHVLFYDIAGGSAQPSSAVPGQAVQLSAAVPALTITPTLQ